MGSNTKTHTDFNLSPQRATSCHATPLHSTQHGGGCCWLAGRSGARDKGTDEASTQRSHTRPIPPASAGTLTEPRCLLETLRRDLN